MGFVAKSVFWLGLVYSAMPFDSGAPVALAPSSGATPHEASSPLESLAAAVVPVAREYPDSWKSAGEIAAALCAPGCLRSQLSLANDSATASLRRAPREKSGREGAVRPPAANHIRSQDRQT